jgi:hypothetical protein
MFKFASEVKLATLWRVITAGVGVVLGGALGPVVGETVTVPFTGVAVGVELGFGVGVSVGGTKVLVGTDVAVDTVVVALQPTKEATKNAANTINNMKHGGQSLPQIFLIMVSLPNPNILLPSDSLIGAQWQYRHCEHR